VNCRCRCGCSIWSSEKSHRLICRHCEAGKHTGTPDEGKKGRLVREVKIARCRCGIPLMRGGRGGKGIIHDPKYFLWNGAHEVQL
jgi:hypothetical protein